jgi:protocatechuate 3,4-dioxygenase beta subunit
MDKLFKGIVSTILVIAVAALLAFPFVPALASTPEAVGGQGGSNNGGRQVTSLDISKDIDSVTAPGAKISLEKTSSESNISMEVGDSHDVSFTIAVDVESSDLYNISGNIFVENTGDWPANVIAVSDTVWYKAGGPAWQPATTNVVTTVPIGPASIPTGTHVYSYTGTFTLPVPLSSVTSMSNLIEITIDNHPNDGVHKFHYRQDFQKPSGGQPGTVLLEDVETITPNSGLSYEIKSVTINGAAASLTGPWSLDLANAPFTVIIDKTLTASAAGEYVLNNKAIIGDLEDDVDVFIEVDEPEKPKGAIEGYKWLDLNGDGQHGEDEPALEGVTIELWRDGQLIATAITGQDGHYEFKDLEVGAYTVKEIVPDGYYATSPDNVEVIVEAEKTKQVDFLNAEYARLSGIKLLDSDGSPLAGVEFVLEGDDFLKEVKSDASGNFDFGWLMPGDYVLYEKVPEGYYPVTSVERHLELANGEHAIEQFRNDRFAVVSGTKWLDLNGDGIHQDGEPALSGVKIILEDDDIFLEDITDKDGRYSFEELYPGAYMVSEEVPAGYYATGAVEVGFQLDAGEDEEIDFLNAELAAVNGTKWLDLNGDGQFNQGEEGLEGVTIRLLDSNGDIFATAVTADDGSYTFDGLKAGSYTVEEIVPEGYTATSPVSVSFDLAPGEIEVVDFHNAQTEVAAQVITPADEGQGSQQTLPVTGFELTYLLMLIGAAILLGMALTSFGLVKLTR